MKKKSNGNDRQKEDNNNGGSYRESYSGRGDHQEDNFSNERGGWESDRSGHERNGYGRPQKRIKREQDLKVKK